MKRSLVVGGIVAVVIVGIAAAIYFNSDSTITSDAKNDSVLSFSTLVTSDTPLKGDPSAPITLIEFGDFQCPNCGRFAKITSPQIESEYVDSGLVSMAFKHFTVIGPDSKTAAVASQCAKEQGMFWKFHDEMYINQGHENSGWASKENMMQVASDIGLDRQSFDSCLDSNKYQSLIESDLDLAKQLNFRGTPSFLIIQNDGSKPQALTGAYPYETFQKIFDEMLE